MESPLSEMAASAVATHEMFESFVSAGFTRTEALYLVGQILAAAMGNQKGA